ncbi:uncharacterized protein LOC131434006 [Malaya genurostris]|uniref:uncharacterized protein LOC131434006 n=1 Tax=Malaya genurostris TaxID=325434 RepID=UPI0026F39C16|nr:uncharacterized protein LOC131434006 [Malaya genurostris]
MSTKKGFSLKGGVEPHHHVNNVVYMKLAIVNGIQVNAFIDLGSERTLIAERVAKKLQMNIKTDTSVLKGFAGGECRSVGAVTECVEIDNFTNLIDILVVPDNTMEYDMLIGDDFFCKRGVSVVKTLDTISIQCENPVMMYVREKKRMQANVLLTIDDLIVDPSATESGKSKLINLINRYRHCFAVDRNEIGYTDIETMKITLKENKVVRHVPYRVAHGQRKFLQDEINSLLENDIIEESSSEFASPVVIVPKRTGDYRMCVDYRMMNAIH